MIYLKNLSLLSAAVALMLGFAHSSYANCDNVVSNVVMTLGHEPNTNTLTACKILPADHRKSIVAVASFQKGSNVTVPAEPGVGLYDLDVLVIKTQNGETLQRISQKGALTSDSLTLTGITIDTAVYRLAQDVRAFGIRARHYYSAVHASSEHEKISLYANRGGKLVQVMNHLIVEQKTYSQMDECADELVETTRTLALSDRTTHGYANLLVREKTIKTVSSLIKDTCQVTKQLANRDYTLRFDGDTYRVPEELQR